MSEKNLVNETMEGMELVEESSDVAVKLIIGTAIVVAAVVGVCIYRKNKAKKSEEVVEDDEKNSKKSKR